MSVRPGSGLWLLRHELRLFWRGAVFNRKKDGAPRRLNKRAMASWAVLWLILHAGAYAALHELHRTAPSPASFLPALTIILASLFMLMLSSGLKSSVEVLFERGDLDLLLSSPLPSRSIFTVRLLGIVVAVGGIYLFFLAPFANAGLLLGQFRWLGIYPALIGAAAVASSLAMLMTLALVRVLGARRTRVVAQLIGALSGAAMFLISQAFTLLSDERKAQAAQMLARWSAPDSASGTDSILWLPARAVTGDPLPLLGLSMFAACVLVLTVYSTHRFFVHGLQQAASSRRAAQRPVRALRYQFGRGLAHTVLVKEWRLIGRDPHLISQVMLQLLYMLPLLVLVFTNESIRLPVVAAGMTMLSGSIAASLAWIIIQAEDAPDLLLASPANTAMIRLAKLAAAAMPPLVLVCAPLLWLVAHALVSGLLACFTVVGAVFGSCMVVMWSGRPGERGTFSARAAGNLKGMLLEAINNLAWSGLAYLLLVSTGQEPSDWAALAAGLLFVLTSAVPLIAWLTRTRAFA